MSCCGKKREDRRTPAAFISAAAPARPPWKAQTQPAIRPTVEFEYTGKTAMAVIGAVSRLRYTFIKPGAKVKVDARDRASLAALPHLRQAG